jgi:hypothetical protein
MRALRPRVGGISISRTPLRRVRGYASEKAPTIFDSFDNLDEVVLEEDMEKTRCVVTTRRILPRDCCSQTPT